MSEIFFHDTHLHIDLFKEMNSIIRKIENQKSYTIAMTNLPELYKKYSKKYMDFKYIRFALGFHPELITKYSYQMNLFDEEIKNARYVGEIGLDKRKNINDYDMDELNLCIKRDFYFSINPKMLKTKSGRQIIEKIPINRMLIESDAPLATESNIYDFLFMKEITEFIAKIKGIDCINVSNAFRNNFKDLLS